MNKNVILKACVNRQSRSAVQRLFDSHHHPWRYIGTLQVQVIITQFQTHIVFSPFYDSGQYILNMKVTKQLTASEEIKC
jgi:hypothetical protein